MTEQLARQSFGPIANDGTANLPSGGNAQTRMTVGVGSHEQRHVPPVEFGAAVVGLLELTAPPDVFLRTKRHHAELEPPWRDRLASAVSLSARRTP